MVPRDISTVYQYIVPGILVGRHFEYGVNAKDDELGGRDGIIPVRLLVV